MDDIIIGAHKAILTGGELITGITLTGIMYREDTACTRSITTGEDTDGEDK